MPELGGALHRDTVQSRSRPLWRSGDGHLACPHLQLQPGCRCGLKGPLGRLGWVNLGLGAPSLPLTHHHGNRQREEEQSGRAEGFNEQGCGPQDHPHHQLLQEEATG